MPRYSVNAIRYSMPNFRKIFPNPRKLALEKERDRLRESLERTTKKAIVLFHPRAPQHANTVFRDLDKCAVWKEMSDTTDALEKVHREIHEIEDMY